MPPRTIRVALFGEYAWLDKQGRPLPFKGSFSYAVFTNDFMHACGHLHACCEHLGLSADATTKEYR